MCQKKNTSCVFEVLIFVGYNSRPFLSQQEKIEEVILICKGVSRKRLEFLLETRLLKRRLMPIKLVLPVSSLMDQKQYKIFYALNKNVLAENGKPKQI